MLNALTNVRFWGQSGHSPTAAYQTRFISTQAESPIGPIAFDPAPLSCRCYFPGPAELGAVNPYAVHDHGQSTRQGHNRLCRDGGKRRADFKRDAREDQLLAAGRGDGLGDLRIVERVHGRAIDDRAGAFRLANSSAAQSMKIRTRGES